MDTILEVIYIQCSNRNNLYTNIIIILNVEYLKIISILNSSAVKFQILECSRQLQIF